MKGFNKNQRKRHDAEVIVTLSPFRFPGIFTIQLGTLTLTRLVQTSIIVAVNAPETSLSRYAGWRGWQGGGGVGCLVGQRGGTIDTSKPQKKSHREK